MPRYDFTAHVAESGVRLEPTTPLTGSDEALFTVSLTVASIMGQMGYAPMARAERSRATTEQAVNPTELLSGAKGLWWSRRGEQSDTVRPEDENDDPTGGDDNGGDDNGGDDNGGDDNGGADENGGCPPGKEPGMICVKFNHPDGSFKVVCYEGCV